MLKNILTFAANFSYPLSSNEFLSFSENFTSEFMIRFCFTRLGVPLVSNPGLRSFSAHSYANDSANPANPVLTPWFIFIVQMMVARRAGGGGWGVGGGGSKFNMYFLTAGPTQIYTSQPFSLHCNKKFIHVAGDHHGSRQNIQLVRTEAI